MSELAVTTNPGLESLAFEELQERLAAAGHGGGAAVRVGAGLRGRLQVRSGLSEAELLPVALGLRTVHHVLRPLARLVLPEAAPLDALADLLARLEVPELDRGAAFRITATRHGRHGFSSVDMQRAAGAAVQRRTGAPVDLTGYDVELRVDVIDQTCAVALQLTRQPLSRRYDLPYRQTVSLKPNVAHAAVRLVSRGHAPRQVLDPFCGAGTILLEAGALLPGALLLGCDRNPVAVAGTQANLAAEGLSKRAELQRLDALALADTFPPGSIDAIVCNPPYGTRLKRGTRFGAFYARFLEQAQAVLAPGGRLVLLAQRRGAFNVALRRSTGLRVRDVRVIEMGGVYPGIFVLERR